MRFPGITIIRAAPIANSKSRRPPRRVSAWCPTGVLICLAFLSADAAGQRVAAIAPDGNSRSAEYAERLLSAMPSPLRVVDISAASSAFESVPVENPYNLNLDEARRIGAVIGCDYFLLIAAANQRRSSSAKPSFFEAYASIFLASSRSGRLILWTLDRVEGESAESADEMLINSAGKMAAELRQKIISAREGELAAQEFTPFTEVPEEGKPEAKGLRPPLPYRRIKPEYTLTAYLYSVIATVDIFVDITAEGEIANIDIARWAGYGLDESVIDNVRKMNWRPATRNGRKLPMRVLLRYNFTKIEKTDN